MSVGTFTFYWQNIYLDLFFGGRPYTPPRVLYFGLNLLSGNRYGPVTEPPRSAGYARVAYPNGPGGWEPADPGYRRNSRPVVFPRPTGDWGALQSVILTDGTWVLAVAPLVTPIAPKSGSDPPTFAPGTFLIGTS